jgi:hypothetical protein
VCINYKTRDFVKRVKEETGRQGIFSTIKTLLFSFSFIKGWLTFLMRFVYYLSFFFF